MSSNIGERSGNRGRCAQPCRKTYSVFNKNNELLFENIPILSPKDTALMNNVKSLVDLKIDSFKIEGRMKKSEYVYGSVEYYKNLLEGKKIDESLLSELSKKTFYKWTFIKRKR